MLPNSFLTGTCNFDRFHSVATITLSDALQCRTRQRFYSGEQIGKWHNLCGGGGSSKDADGGYQTSDSPW